MLNKIAVQVALSALFSFGALMAPAMADTATPTQKPAAAPSGTINWDILNLTPDQVKQINIIRINYSKKAIQLKADIKLKQLDIQNQLMSPAPNPSLVRKLLQEKLAKESELQAASLESFLAIKKLLTPEQLVILPKAVNMHSSVF